MYEMLAGRRVAGQRAKVMEGQVDMSRSFLQKGARQLLGPCSFKHLMLRSACREMNWRLFEADTVTLTGEGH